MYTYIYNLRKQELTKTRAHSFHCEKKIILLEGSKKCSFNPSPCLPTYNTVLLKGYFFSYPTDSEASVSIICITPLPPYSYPCNFTVPSLPFFRSSFQWHLLSETFLATYLKCHPPFSLAGTTIKHNIDFIYFAWFIMNFPS